MKKRLIYSLMAFLMLSVNFVGVVPVFADELLEAGSSAEVTSGTDTEPAVEETTTEEVSGGEETVDEDLPEETPSEEVTNEITTENITNVELGGAVAAPVVLNAPQTPLLGSNNATVVTNFEELNNAICDGGEILIDANITFSDYLSCYVSKETIIDFNGHILKSENEYGSNIWVNGAELTLKDSVGGGGYVDVVDGNIAISVEEGSLIIESGTITASTWGVVAWKNGTVTMNGGEIIAEGIGISGNGSANYAGAKFYINGGEIISNEIGIYAPQIDGVTEINGGKIVAEDTGIEIRAGSLTVNGGEITANSNTYSVTANGSGTTTVGAAIAIAQHSTKQPITVTINGGTFTANVPISEANPQGNSEEDLAKVSVNVTGGSFNTTGENSEYSNDKTGYITGGTFSAAPKIESIADGYDAYELPNNGGWVVDKKAVVNFPADPILLAVGETYDLSNVLDETGKKYADIGIGGEGATRNGQIITATSAGGVIVNVQLHNLIAPVDDNVILVVYDVEIDSNDELTNDTDREKVAEFVLETIKNFIENGIFENDNMWTYDDVDILNIMAAENTSLFRTVFSNVLVDEDDYDYIEAHDEVMAEIKEGETIAAIYEGYIEIYIGNTYVGLVYELDSSVSVSVEIPEAYREAPAGYIRTFYIIRGHEAMDGTETAQRITPQRVGNNLVFDNDKFSSFTIVYEDTLMPEAPDTGGYSVLVKDTAASNTLSVFVTVGGLMSIIALAAAVKIAKR